MKKLALLTLLLASCVNESQLAPCASDDLCLPGFQCLDGLCSPCSGDDCPTTRGLGIGPRGGTVCGAGDVCLHVPADALIQDVNLIVTSTLAGLRVPNLTHLSGVFEIRPSAVQLLQAATIEIPISSTIAVGRIGVYQATSTSGPWTKLSGTSNAVTARGETQALSLFTAAYE